MKIRKELGIDISRVRRKAARLFPDGCIDHDILCPPCTIMSAIDYFEEVCIFLLKLEYEENKKNQSVAEQI